MLAKKELSFQEIIQNVRSLFGAGVDTVSNMFERGRTTFTYVFIYSFIYLFIIYLFQVYWRNVDHVQKFNMVFLF